LNTENSPIVCPKVYHISEHTSQLVNKIRRKCYKDQWKFSIENVDIVVNVDETYLLYHPLGEKVIAPTGMMHVRTAVQADNEKRGATVMIACRYWTSSILPLMIIFIVPN